MDLELKWRDLTWFEVLGRATATHEEALETAIPEYCPDMNRIVDATGQLQIRDREITGGAVMVSGMVSVRVLYSSEESSGLRSLEVSVPFRCTQEGGNLAACRVLRAEGRLLLTEAKAVSARRLYVRVLPEVTVTGPESVVNSIAMATISVDLDGRRESISESYNYTLCDDQGKPVDARLITTDVDQIRLDVSIRRVKDLRLTYNLVPGGGADEDNTTVKLSAETIRVSGSEAALENLGDTLSIGTINLADITKSATSLTFAIALPEGITNLTGITEVTADVSFHGLATKELTVTNIQSVNIPEGLTVELITEKLTVTLRGPTTLISTVTPEDVAVIVDFTGAEVGTSTFKATVSLSDDYKALGTLKAEPVSAKIDLAEK